MHPSIYSQADDPSDRDKVSQDSGITFDPSEDTTRQEFAEEADINVLLKRYGVGAFSGQTPVYGEVDFSEDLTLARIALNDARAAIEQLPDEVLRAHGGVDGAWRAFLEGRLEAKAPAEGAAPLRPEAEPPKPAEPAREP